MSFTSIVKNEISKIQCEKSEYIAELSGFIANNITINEKSFLIITENSSVARRIFTIIKNLYNRIPVITVRRRFNFNKFNTYILEYKNSINILDDLSIIKNNELLDIPNDYIIGDIETKKAYLRGVFLSSGSINDPKKSRYHLEFFIKNKNRAYFIKDLLNEFELNSKVISRSKGYMVYIKESERISDYLRMIKAYQSILYYEDIRIYRDHVNMTNRLNNCEQANVEKTINSANKHIKCINIIQKHDALKLLDEKSKLVVEYRLKYPESSLLELSEIINYETNIKISKSGLNHRLRAIKELSERLEK